MNPTTEELLTYLDNLVDGIQDNEEKFKYYLTIREMVKMNFVDQETERFMHRIQDATIRISNMDFSVGQELLDEVDDEETFFTMVEHSLNIICEELEHRATKRTNLDSLMECMHLPALQVDHRFKIISCNTKLSSLLGYQKEELIDRSIEYIYRYNYDIKNNLEFNGPTKDREAKLQMKNGTKINMWVSVRPFSEQDNGQVIETNDNMNTAIYVFKPR